LKLKKPIGLKPETPAEFIYYEFAINYESAVIAGWGAVRVSFNTDFNLNCLKVLDYNRFYI